MKETFRTAGVIAVLAASGPACAVSLNVDGMGQALIYPYYTAQSSGANPYNTYLSLVNHTADAKAVRVRLRESRNSREVASFNVFLSPNDMWTGAIVPLLNSPAAALISADRSCASPAFVATAELPPGVIFQNAFYSGTFSDSNGEGLERTREGWVEMIEMATLTGATAARVTHNGSGVPANCAAVQGNAALDVAPPTGGLSGTLTLINVASGMDFTVNAEALADLGTRPFYRPPSDPYPDLNATEIDPVSIVVANGSVYRSSWNRAADAVSAVLMRSEALAEYVLDDGTGSRTDWVVNFPTRHHFVSTATSAAPFSRPGTWSGDCGGGLAQNQWRGEEIQITFFNREEGYAVFNSAGSEFGILPFAALLCAAASVFNFVNGSAHLAGGASASVLGSVSRGLSTGAVPVTATMQNGWARLSPAVAMSLTSLGASTRTSLATGATSLGPHSFSGLPMVGLMVRTFVNGTLVCNAGACQGNYGGSFPLKFRRGITPAN
jgi:hypothetical protein